MSKPNLKIVDRALYKITEDLNGIAQILEDPDVSPELFTDTLDAIEMEFDLKSQQVASMIVNIGSPIEAIEVQIERLNKKKKAIVNSQDRLKNYLLTNMELLEKKTIKGDLFNITAVKGRASVVISNMEELDEEYVRVSTKIESDKNAIKKALDSGLEVAGAHYETGKSSIQIR